MSEDDDDDDDDDEFDEEESEEEDILRGQEFSDMDDDDEDDDEEDVSILSHRRPPALSIETHKSPLSASAPALSGVFPPLRSFRFFTSRHSAAQGSCFTAPVGCCNHLTACMHALLCRMTMTSQQRGPPSR